MTHADWLILGYTTVIIIFGIVCYSAILAALGVELSLARL